VSPAAPGPGAGDSTMSVARANLVALAWLPVSGLLAAAPFAVLWGPDRLRTLPAALPALPAGLVLVAAGVLVHELLHAGGFLLFGRAPRGQVRIGFQRRTLTPFASCGAPVTASAYRAAGLLPGVVLGGLPLLAAWATGSAPWLLWGWAMLALAGGDVAAVWAMRSVPGDAMVVDDPRLVGCRRV
jgi:hypothetical protein